MSAETPTWAGPFHVRQIARGEYGQLSKIEEERQEALDALEQGQRLMLLVELADMLGAIEGVVARDGASVVDLWAAAPEPEPIDFDRYERTVLARLDQIGALLEQAEAGTNPAALAAIVALLVDISAAHDLSFDDLRQFAELRSAVARYALQNH